jgi:hypothetical protein
MIDPVRCAAQLKPGKTLNPFLRLVRGIIKWGIIENWMLLVSTSGEQAL